MSAPFTRVAIIGLGLQGGSIGLALAEYLPAVATTGYDVCRLLVVSLIVIKSV